MDNSCSKNHSTLHRKLTDCEIIHHTSQLGFEPFHVHHFLKEDRRLPMYMVTFTCNLESKSIFQLTSLFYIAIRVEAYETTTYSTSMSINHVVNKLQNHINTALPWLKDWKISLNPNKSTTMQFGKKTKNHRTHIHKLYSNLTTIN